MMCSYFTDKENIHSYINFYSPNDSKMSMQWNTTPQELKNIISNLTVYLAMIESDPDEQHSINVDI